MADQPASLIFIDAYQIHPLLRVGRQKTWRWRALNGGNMQPMAHSGKTYFNYGDAVDAAYELFGRNSNVYLRQAEHGDVEMRLASDYTPPA